MQYVTSPTEIQRTPDGTSNWNISLNNVIGFKYICRGFEREKKGMKINSDTLLVDFKL